MIEGFSNYGNSSSMSGAPIYEQFDVHSTTAADDNTLVTSKSSDNCVPRHELEKLHERIHELEKHDKKEKEHIDELKTHLNKVMGRRHEHEHDSEEDDSDLKLGDDTDDEQNNMSTSSVVIDEQNNMYTTSAANDNDTDDEPDMSTNAVGTTSVDNDSSESFSNYEHFSNKDTSTEPDYAKRAGSANLILKSLLFACLFYVLAHPDTYSQAIKKMSSKLTKEHGLYICMAVFAVVFYVIGIFL